LKKLRSALVSVGVVVALPIIMLVLLLLLPFCHLKYYKLKPPKERCLGCPLGGLCESEEPY